MPAALTNSLRSALLPLVASAGVMAAEVETGATAVLEPYAVLAGGTSAGTGIHGLVQLEADFRQGTPADAPFHWSGHVSLLALKGRGPTERHLGDFLAASNIEGYASLRLYTWWLEVAQDRWSVRAGALLADEEFAGTEAAGGLLNSAFG